jgi:hypothetical protein
MFLKFSGFGVTFDADYGFGKKIRKNSISANFTIGFNGNID